MPGRHNVQNALAAIGVALELGIDDATIQQRLRPVRRGQAALHQGRRGRRASTIIDDYGHHPVEIRAVLSAARESAQGRVIAVVQPHRYSRLGNLMEEFQERVQRCRSRVCDAGLCGGRGAGGGRRCRGAGRGAEAARASLGGDGRRCRRAGGGAGGDRAAGRSGRVPGRGRHHEMGGRAGRRDRGARGHKVRHAFPRPCALARSRGVGRAAHCSRRAQARAEPIAGRYASRAARATRRSRRSSGSRPGGAAEWLFEPADVDDLAAFLRDARSRRRR